MPHRLLSLEVDESDTGLGAESAGLMGAEVLISMDRGLPPTASFPAMCVVQRPWGTCFQPLPAIVK